MSNHYRSTRCGYALVDWPDNMPVAPDLTGISKRQKRKPEPGKTVMPTYAAVTRFYAAVEEVRGRESDLLDAWDIPF